MIQNIVFDIGNVLLKFNPKEHFRYMKHGSEVSSFIFYSDIWKQYDLGKVTLEEVKEHMLKQYEQYHEEINHIIDNWMEALHKTSLYDVLHQLKNDGYNIYLLSNLSKDAELYIKDQYSLFDVVHGYVVSCDVNVIKPDVKIYEILKDTYSLSYESTLFLDDLYDNIHTAKQLGMYTIHCVDVNEAKTMMFSLLEKEQE